MLCPICKEYRAKEDFLRPNQGCYKCESSLRLQQSEKKECKKIILCRMCKVEIIQKEDTKKRQRNVFCSPECAKKGHIEINKQYWTRKVCIGVIK